MTAIFRAYQDGNFSEWQSPIAAHRPPSVPQVPDDPLASAGMAKTNKKFETSTLACLHKPVSCFFGALRAAPAPTRCGRLPRCSTGSDPRWCWCTRQKGNSHMLMLDKNNLAIADLIIGWIGENVRGM
jgi:hypothetical protein